MEMHVKQLSLISSSHKIIETFLSEATILGIRVPRILELSHGQSDLPRQVEQFIRHLNDESPTVVLIVNSHEAVAIAEHLKHHPLRTRPTWLIGSLGLELKKLKAWRRVFHKGIFVEPHMPELNDFKQYFIEALQVITFYVCWTLYLSCILAIRRPLQECLLHFLHAKRHCL